MKFRVCLLVVVAGLLLLPGCGKTTMAPVKGRITCNGKPVKEAAISFDPVPADEKDREPGKPGTGFSDAEGNYVLSTFKPHDGALVGQHQVTITLDDTNPAKCRRKTQVLREVKVEGNELNIELNDQ